jgi:hypothetical protein
MDKTMFPKGHSPTFHCIDFGRHMVLSLDKSSWPLLHPLVTVEKDSAPGFPSSLASEGGT